jgi:CHAT domain-containing protein/Tfp pilus assembly protein PilF
MRAAGWIGSCLALGISVLPTRVLEAAAQVDRPPRSLPSAGASIELPLAAGEAHVYTVDLRADEYLDLRVLQQGIDVAVDVDSPDGKRLVEVDGPTGKYGGERLRFIAAVPGTHRIDVRSLEKSVPPGRYRLDVGERRSAEGEDRRRIEAQDAYLQATRLRLENKAEQLRLAIEQYDRASRIWKLVGERADEATALNDSGYAHRLLSDYTAAVERYQRALVLRRDIGDGPGEAQTLTNLGAIAYFRGENQRALEYYEQALPLRRAEGNLQEQALLLSNMGEVFALWGEHQQALDYFRRALPAERAVGDRLREALTLSNIGQVYSDTGQYREALPFFDQAIASARASGNPRIVGRILDNRGAALRDSGERARAIATYEEALALRRTVGDRLGESETLGAMGVVSMQSGDTNKAFEHFTAALALQRAVGSPRKEAATLNNIASLLAQQGEHDAALDALNQSMAIRRRVQDRRGEAESWYGLARVHRLRGALADAASAGNAALDIIEALRTKVVSQEMRASYFATSQEMYAFVIGTLMDLESANPGSGYAAQALQVSERARARTLLDGLVETRAGVRQGLSAELRERERNLQDRINAGAEHQSQLLSGSHTAAEADRASRDLAALLTELQELEAEIRASSPRYAALTRPQPLDVREIEARVLDEDTLLLEYALGTERSYLWALTSGSMSSYVLPPRARIDAAVQRLYALLTARNEDRPGDPAPVRRRRIASADADLERAARELGDLLLAPVAQRLIKKRVLVVADAGLQFVPFGVLPDPKDRQPLIIGHEVVSSPSASVMAMLREEPRDSARGRKVAIIADPVFSGDDPRVRRHVSALVDTAGRLADGAVAREPAVPRSGADVDSSGFRRLRFSRDEANAIASFMPPADRLDAFDFKASRASVLSADLSQYGIVHFSTHGLLNSTHPELSGLVLSLYDEHGTPQDGFLRLHDIYNLKLNANLVVLSACETALGREIRGEGLIGLARGFMYAGAPRVVASLWSVDDQATSMLMKRFYEGMLVNGQSPAAALRAAQLSMWQEKRWHTPYYWAAFILQGEWR